MSAKKKAPAKKPAAKPKPKPKPVVKKTDKDEKVASGAPAKRKKSTATRKKKALG